MRQWKEGKKQTRVNSRDLGLESIMEIPSTELHATQRKVRITAETALNRDESQKLEAEGGTILSADLECL